MLDGIVDLFAPAVKLAGKAAMKPLLKRLMEKEPEHGKVALATMYPVIDAEVETLAKTTKTKLDDAAAEAGKEAIEEVASEYGIELSNVDND